MSLVKVQNLDKAKKNHPKNGNITYLSIRNHRDIGFSGDLFCCTKIYQNIF